MKRFSLVVLIMLLAAIPARAQTGSDGLPPMPNALFDCFAQAQFTLSPTGVITPVSIPHACIQSVAKLDPTMDWTYVYNWQQSSWTPSPSNLASNGNYLAYGWDSHCANCGPKYSQQYAYTYVYQPPTATPAPATPTPWSTTSAAPTAAPTSWPTTTAAPSAVSTSIPIPITDTVIAGWDFGDLAWTIGPGPTPGAPAVVSIVPGRNGNLPPTISSTALWYAALESGSPMPCYDAITGQPLWTWTAYGSSWWSLCGAGATATSCPGSQPGQMLALLTSHLGNPPWVGAFPNGPVADTAPWLAPSGTWTPAPSASASAPWTPVPSASATVAPWTPAPTSSATAPWTPAPSATWTPTSTATPTSGPTPYVEPAYSNVPCQNGVDVAPIVSNLLQNHITVELPTYNGTTNWSGGSGGTNQCLFNESINGRGLYGPIIHGNGAIVVLSTGSAPAWDFTGSVGAEFHMPYQIAGGTNPSLIGITMGPIANESNVGSHRIIGGTLCMSVPNCNQGPSNDNSVAIVISASEQNTFANPIWVQGGTAVQISGINAAHNHTAISETFIGGQYVSTSKSAFVLDGGGIWNLGMQGTLLSQPGAAQVQPGTVGAISLNATQDPGNWNIQARVEKWSQLVQPTTTGLSVKNSQFVVPVPIGVATQ